MPETTYGTVKIVIGDQEVTVHNPPADDANLRGLLEAATSIEHTEVTVHVDPTGANPAMLGNLLYGEGASQREAQHEATVVRSEEERQLIRKLSTRVTKLQRLGGGQTNPLRNAGLFNVAQVIDRAAARNFDPHVPGIGRTGFNRIMRAIYEDLGLDPHMDLGPYIEQVIG